MLSEADCQEEVGRPFPSPAAVLLVVRIHHRSCQHRLDDGMTCHGANCACCHFHLMALHHESAVHHVALGCLPGRDCWILTVHD